MHLDGFLIQAYLGNMKRILKAGANVVIHYSDKTKVTGQLDESFAESADENALNAIRGGL